jgi:hypothetical protein
MSWRPSPSVDARAPSPRLTWLLALLVTTMRVAWIWPWLLLLGAWMAPSYAEPVLPLWSLFALMLGGRVAAHVATVRTANIRQARVWMAVTGPLILLLLLWWQYGRPLALWDVRWLQLATGTPELWAREVAPVALAFVTAAALWLRGVVDGGAAPDHETIVGAFGVGSVAFALLLLLNQIAGSAAVAGVQGWLVLFVAAGMASLALASLERSLYAGSAASASRLRLNRYWLSSVALVIVAVLVLAFLLSALIAPEAVAQTIGLLTPIVDLLAQVLLAVIYAAVYVLFLVLTPLIEWLRQLMANRELLETPFELAPMQPLSPLLTEQAAGAGTEMVEPLRWGAILAVLIVSAILFALAMRFLRVIETPEMDETRESILSRSLLADQLRSLWARLRGQPGDETAAFLPLDSESPARRQVRARYQTFLKAMAARGQPRPPGATPQTYADQLDGLTAAQHAVLRPLTERYVAVRYGDAAPDPDDPTLAEVDWREEGATPERR